MSYYLKSPMYLSIICLVIGLGGYYLADYHDAHMFVLWPFAAFGVPAFILSLHSLIQSSKAKKDRMPNLFFALLAAHLASLNVHLLVNFLN